MAKTVTNTFGFYSVRSLVALISLLMSAFVLAEQSDAVFSYDELMKGTIFGSSRNWRSDPTETDPADSRSEWRADQLTGTQDPFGGSGYKGSSQEDRLRKPETEISESFTFRESQEQSNLFKIEL